MNQRNVSEQLLYEVGDPAAYLTPDVMADFTSGGFGRAARRRRARDGRPGQAGHRIRTRCPLLFAMAMPRAACCWCPDQERPRRRKCGSIILDRLKRAGFYFQFTNIEALGSGDCVPGVVKAGREPPGSDAACQRP